MQKKKIVIVLLLLVGAAFGVWYFFARPASGELVLLGNVDQRQVELAFIDSERIAEILVLEGTEVQPGQVLARLETRRLRDAIAVAQAGAESAQAAYDRLKNGTRPEEIDKARAAVASAGAENTFAQAQYERIRKLWDESDGLAVSKKDVDDAQLRVDVAAARLEELRKTLRLAEIGPRKEDIDEAAAVLRVRQNSLQELRNRLGDAELKSPAYSVVNRRLLEPGDMALPQRAVFSLAVLSPKWVRAYVVETDLGRIRQGMKASIFIDSHPNKGFDATVSFISSVAEFTPKTVETAKLRTSLVYEVRLQVEDPENILRLGMPATVRFP